jgi:hypothetical protein
MLTAHIRHVRCENLDSRWSDEMKYVILIYSNPQSREIWSGLTDEQRAVGLREYAALNEDLASSGELIGTQALADPSQTRRLAVHDGETMTSDGPFAEAKEQLAGFYLLECDSIERAVEHAARVPEASLGLVEVRPVMTYEGLEM